jgi:5-methylcytosine-specific restriction protein A
LEVVAGSIASAREESFANHPVAQRIRGTWRDSVRDLLADDSYRVYASAGNTQWADSVWLGIFDRTVTESAQRGFYVVYLVARGGERIFLSLNQGTTEIYDRVGGRRYRGVLETTAQRDVGLLATEDLNELVTGPIDLDGQTTLSRGYQSGNILAIPYIRGAIPHDDALEDDLTRLLVLYRSLVEGRDQVDNDEDDPLGNGPSSGLEARRYRWHRRAERSQSLAKAAKKFHGTICQVEACKKDLTTIYGELADGYIEAHHLSPFASLNGRPAELDPKSDFAVVCPDCHRMLHRRTPEPYSLAELSEILKASRSAFM